MFIHTSKTALRISAVGAILTVGFFLVARSQPASYTMLCIGLPLLFLTLSVFIRWACLKDRENETAFNEAFGIVISGCQHLEDKDEFGDIQLLVNRVLREKAKAFHAARMEQQGQFAGNVRGDRSDAELQANVQAAKHAFWQASDIARAYRFDVKKKYTEWLESPAASEK
jgi:hypothetical protein